MPCKPLVYSFGIGWDVSFDLALIHEFNAEVFAFDFTPSVLEWAEKNVSDPKFHIIPCGLSDKDGTEKFYSSGGYGTIAPSENERRNFIEVPVKRLITIMKELGHKHIDILKMDIEGAEFSVIPDILDSGASFGQLCVEVHNRFYDDGDEKLKALISQLNNAGFYIISVSPTYEELTFIRK